MLHGYFLILALLPQNAAVPVHCKVTGKGPERHESGSIMLGYYAQRQKVVWGGSVHKKLLICRPKPGTLRCSTSWDAGTPGHSGNPCPVNPGSAAAAPGYNQSGVASGRAHSPACLQSFVHSAVEITDELIAVMKLVKVGNLPRRFHCEAEDFRTAVIPALERGKLREPIECVVQFNGIEMLTIIFEPFFLRKAFRIKDLLPVLIVKSRTADPPVHHVFFCRNIEFSFVVSNGLKLLIFLSSCFPVFFLNFHRSGIHKALKVQCDHK